MADLTYPFDEQDSIRVHKYDRDGDDRLAVRAVEEIFDDEDVLVEHEWEREGDDEESGRFRLAFDGAEMPDGELTVRLKAIGDGQESSDKIQVENFRWSYRDGEARLKIDVGSTTLSTVLFKNVGGLEKADEVEAVESAANNVNVDETFQTVGGPDYEDFVGLFFAAEELGEGNEAYDRISNEAADDETTVPMEEALHSDLLSLDPRHESGKTWRYRSAELKIEEEGEDESDRVVFVRLDATDEDEAGTLSFLDYALRVALLQVAIRVPLLLYGTRKVTDSFDDDLVENYPSDEDFLLARPVDLDPTQLREELKDEGLFYPAHVLDAACTSLNSGKHVIFTGPPGCGKSKLAIKLAESAREDDAQGPLVATASPAWTTNEVIGRYLPRQDGDGLRFEPGFFLKASGDQRWLMIDELNRADIDSAFGELFSVLAGDMAEVPYRQEDSDEKESPAGGEEGESTPQDVDPGNRVRIVPFGTDTDEEEDFRDYHVPQDFRLLATMNDADRSRLHQLSFALQRRFNIVRVEAPSPGQIQDLLEERLNDRADRFEIHAGENSKRNANWVDDETSGNCERHCYRFLEKESSARSKTYLNDAGDGGAWDVLRNLFANAGDESKDEEELNFEDLVRERIVGVATVLDIVDFVGEALRAPDSNVDDGKGPSIHYDGKDFAEEDGGDGPGQTDMSRALARTHIALALAMNVVPQLDQLTSRPEKLFDAIEFMFRTFDSHDVTWFLALEPAPEGAEHDCEYELEERGGINDFLAEEIALQLGHGSIDRYSKEWENLEDAGLISEVPDVF